MLTSSLLGVYHQGMGTSPVSVSASLVCLMANAAAMACLGSTRASLPSLLALLCAESAVLSAWRMLLSAFVGNSCTLLDAVGSFSMFMLAPELSLQPLSCHMLGEGGGC